MRFLSILPLFLLLLSNCSTYQTMVTHPNNAKARFEDEPKDPVSTEPAAQESIPEEGLTPDTKNAVMVTLEDVDGSNVDAIIETLEKFKADGQKNVWIRIDSYGGGVAEGSRLIHEIEGYGQPITCVASDKAMSEGFYILQSCNTRLMTKRAVLMAHQPAVSGLQGNSQVLKDEAKYLDILMDGFIEQCLTRMKITKKEFLDKTTNKVWYMGWEEATKYGAIDGTIEPKELPPITPLVRKPSLMQLLLGGLKSK